MLIVFLTQNQQAKRLHGEMENSLDQTPENCELLGQLWSKPAV